MRRLATIVLFLSLASCAHGTGMAAPSGAPLVPGRLEPPPWTEAPDALRLPSTSPESSRTNHAGRDRWLG